MRGVIGAPRMLRPTVTRPGSRNTPRLIGGPQCCLVRTWSQVVDRAEVRMVLNQGGANIRDDTPPHQECGHLPTVGPKFMQNPGRCWGPFR